MTDGVGPLSLFPSWGASSLEINAWPFCFFHSTLLLKGAKKVLDISSHCLTVKLKEPMNQKTPTFLCMEFIMVMYMLLTQGHQVVLAMNEDEEKLLITVTNLEYISTIHLKKKKNNRLE